MVDIFKEGKFDLLGFSEVKVYVVVGYGPNEEDGEERMTWTGLWIP